MPMKAGEPKPKSIKALQRFTCRAMHRLIRDNTRETFGINRPAARLRCLRIFHLSRYNGFMGTWSHSSQSSAGLPLLDSSVFPLSFPFFFIPDLLRFRSVRPEQPLGSSSRSKNHGYSTWTFLEHLATLGNSLLRTLLLSIPSVSTSEQSSSQNDVYLNFLK